ncbi:MAG: NAAT family transporter [Proteobacteria bacterium]|jgi:multiple antibiotic resistance protein|nr:MarC family protein [Alphaproteobacteria bacterium]NCC04155.1 NAAT family transporter [Pseudomonadota bacterium]
MLTQLFLNAFVSLLVIANPLGVASVFVALMAHSSRDEIKATARKSVGVATGILLFFAFFGEWLLMELGIRLPSFHVAGGALLFLIAYQMLFTENRFGASGSETTGYADRTDIAVFPLAIPLIAGPGCMTATILLMSRAQGFAQSTIVLAALFVVMGITYASLLLARRLVRIIGTSGNIIIARVMGVLLAARSVQFIVDGLRDIHSLYFS